MWAACARKPEAPDSSASVSKDVKRPAEAWLAEEPVRLLRDYVRIDTTLGRGEKEGAEFLQRFFDCEGIPAETVCPAPGRCNVLARIEGKRRDGALLLLNHIDVVDAFPQFWQESRPFEGEIRLGFLYGRGVYDMKSLAMAQALALARLKRRGIVPETDVLFVAEADEEVGQRWGMRWLLANRPEWFAGVGEVLNEGGTTEVILRDVVFWGIETLQAGYALREFEAAAEEPLARLAASHPKIASTPVSAAPAGRPGLRPARQPHGLAADRPPASSRPRHPPPGGARHSPEPVRELSRAADRLVADLPASLAARLPPAFRRRSRCRRAWRPGRSCGRSTRTRGGKV